MKNPDQTTGNDKNKPERPTRRSGRNPAQSDQRRETGWKAKVSLTNHGATRPEQTRKVATNGIKPIDVGPLLDEIASALKDGFEVRLSNTRFGEAIRLYQCLTADYDSIFVASQTMRPFRHCIDDTPFELTHKGEKVEVEDAKAAKEEKARAIMKSRAEAQATQHVTPDKMVRCPSCGNVFRVHKQLI